MGVCLFGVADRTGGSPRHRGLVQIEMTSGSQSVSVAPDGTEAVVWQDEASHGSRSVIEVAIARRGRRFGHPRVLASTGGGPSLVGGSLTFPQVVALNGRIAVVWGEQQAARDFFARRPKPYLAAAIAGPAGRFAAGRMLAGTYGDSVVSLAAAADPRGDVIAVYARAIGNVASTKYRTRLGYVVSRAGSGTFERARPVPGAMIGPGTSLQWPGQLSVGPGGVEAPYAIRSKSSLTMRAARLGARAAFAPARTIGTPSGLGNGPAPTGAVLALPGRGAPLAAWTTVDWAHPGTFQLSAGSVNVAQQRPNGAFASTIALTSANSLDQYVLAAATTDRVILLWAQGQPLHQDLIYASRDSHGHFSASRPLAPGAASSPALAAAGKHAIAAWVSGHTLQTALLNG